MTLNERERFIFHMCTAMVLSIEKFQNQRFDMKLIQELVLRNRARHLSKKDVDELTDSMKEEVLLGTSVYEEMMSSLMRKPTSFDEEEGDNLGR